MLSALERAPQGKSSESTLATGGGFASGIQVRDVSLPDMLKHALCLIDSALNEADVMREIAVNAIKEQSSEAGRVSTAAKTPKRASRKARGGADAAYESFRRQHVDLEANRHLLLLLAYAQWIAYLEGLSCVSQGRGARA